MSKKHTKVAPEVPDYGLTELTKSQPELRDGRRTTFVIRMTLQESQVLLDAVNASADDLTDETRLVLHRVMTRLVRGQQALINSRLLALPTRGDLR